VVYNGKMTIAKSKSLRVSYNKVASLSLELIVSRISRYEVDLSYSLMSFVSSSSGRICENNDC
jgi:hypothetical protein